MLEDKFKNFNRIENKIKRLSIKLLTNVRKTSKYLSKKKKSFYNTIILNNNKINSNEENDKNIELKRNDIKLVSNKSNSIDIKKELLKITEKVKNEIYETGISKKSLKNFINKTQKISHKTKFSHKNNSKLLSKKKNKKINKKENKYRELTRKSILYDSLDDDESENEIQENNKNNNFIETIYVKLFIFVLIIYSFFNIFSTPLLIAKGKIFNQYQNKFIKINNYIIDIIFLIDLIISFFIQNQYDNQCNKIFNKKDIIINYLFTWFILDLITSFPGYIISKIFFNFEELKFNSFEDILNSKIKIIFEIFFFIKSLKIFKIYKVYLKNLDFISEKFPRKISELLSIFRFIICFFIIFHYLICIHIYIAKFTYNNWIHFNNYMNDSFISIYICSLYFQIATLTTIGYGDIETNSFIEKAFYIFLLSFDIFGYSYFISFFGYYINNKSYLRMQIINDQKILEELRITYPSLSFKIYNEINHYIIDKAKKKKNLNINLLINSLPDGIKNNILLLIYSKSINLMKFFKINNNTDFILRVVKNFVGLHCKKNSLLIDEGQLCENVIFISEGRLVLEASIDLKNSEESIKKYVNKNFGGLTRELYDKIFLNTSENLNESNYCSNIGDAKFIDIKKKLDNLIVKTKMNNQNYFAEGFYENNNEYERILINSICNYEYNNKPIIKINKEKLIIKVIELQKNEEIGEINIFLNKPFPLTIKVKSRSAHLLLLNKIEFMDIYNYYPNLIRKILKKSFHNLLSIKLKTLKELNKVSNQLSVHLNKIEQNKLMNSIISITESKAQDKSQSKFCSKNKIINKKSYSSNKNYNLKNKIILKLLSDEKSSEEKSEKNSNLNSLKIDNEKEDLKITKTINFERESNLNTLNQLPLKFKNKILRNFDREQHIKNCYLKIKKIFENYKESHFLTDIEYTDRKQEEKEFYFNDSLNLCDILNCEQYENNSLYNKVKKELQNLIIQNENNFKENYTKEFNYSSFKIETTNNFEIKRKISKKNLKFSKKYKESKNEEKQINIGELLQQKLETKYDNLREIKNNNKNKNYKKSENEISTVKADENKIFLIDDIKIDVGINKSLMKFIEKNNLNKIKQYSDKENKIYKHSGKKKYIKKDELYKFIDNENNDRFVCNDIFMFSSQKDSSYSQNNLLQNSNSLISNLPNMFEKKYQYFNNYESEWILKRNTTRLKEKLRLNSEDNVNNNNEKINQEIVSSTNHKLI